MLKFISYEVVCFGYFFGNGIVCSGTFNYFFESGSVYFKRAGKIFIFYIAFYGIVGVLYIGIKQIQIQARLARFLQIV